MRDRVAAIAPASEAVTTYYAKGDGPTASKDFTTTRTYVGDDYAQLVRVLCEERRRHNYRPS